MKTILSLFLIFSFCFSKEVKIKVEKMHCPLCTTMVKKVIKKVDGVKKVKVLLNIKTATVDFDEKKTNIQKILDAIKTTGYEGEVLN